MSKSYTFIDEAANLADENQFFIVGVVSACSKKELGRILKQARRIVLGKKKRQVPEIKSSRVTQRVVNYVTKKLAQKDIVIYAWIVDKEGRRVKDTPENYGLVLAYVLKYGFDLAGWSEVWIDKKYNKEQDERRLNEVLRRILGNGLFNQNKVVFEKSENEAGLGLADFVAGAFYNAYNRGDSRLIEILKPKIVLEEKILWREIKQKAIAPRGSVVPA